MGGFSVDTGAVKGLGDQLSQIVAELEGVGESNDLSFAEAGSREVEQALHEFDGHWVEGKRTLITNLDDLANAINTAASEYEKSDSAVASATGSNDGTA